MDPTQTGAEPKIKLSTYEWDDTKTGCLSFWQFMMDFSMLVRMTLHGDIFEDFLDIKCKRNPVLQQQPQWINGDPDLYVWNGGGSRGPPAKGSPAKSTRSTGVDSDSDSGGAESKPKDRAGSQAATAHSELSMATGITVDAIKNRVGSIPPGSRVRPMDQWEPEVHAADRRLFYTLKNCVKGKAKATLDQVHAPSYVLGMIQLWLVHSVTSSERKLKALAGIQKLEWRGSSSKFQQEATRRINEFYDSGITLEDIILLNVRDAFDGKVQHIKYEIAKDIDAGLGSEPGIIPDLVQKYVTTLASAGVDARPTNYTEHNGDGNGNGTGNGNDNGKHRRNKKKCKRCGRGGHLKTDCYAKTHVDGHDLLDIKRSGDEDAETNAENDDEEDDEGDAKTSNLKPKKLNLAGLHHLLSSALEETKKEKKSLKVGKGTRR